MTFDPLQVIGVAGAVTYVLAYALLQLGLLSGSDYRYTVLNLAAAGMVLVSLTASFNLSSAIIQIFWVGISIIGLTRLYMLHQRARFNPEEAAMVAEKFPRLQRHLARRLLDRGNWIDIAPGTVVATEGEVLGMLYYISEGRSAVTSGGRSIGTCVPTSFLGEMTCLTGAPANATAVTLDWSRFFAISSLELKALFRKEPDLGTYVENRFGDDIHMKLKAANQMLRDRGAQPSDVN